MKQPPFDPENPTEFVETLRIERPDGTVVFGGPTPGGRKTPIPPYPACPLTEKGRETVKRFRREHGLDHSSGSSTAEALASPAREQEREEVRRRRRERCLELRGGIQPDGSHLLDDHCLTEWSSNEEWAVEGAEYVMPPNDNPPVDRTPEEQRILDLVAADRGREYAERWAERILEQARAIGDL